MPNLSRNPFGDFRRECELILRETLTKILKNKILDYALKQNIVAPQLKIPSSLSFGDLASAICFEIARKMNATPQTLADDIVNNADLSKATLVKAINATSGYINFHIDNNNFSQLTLESARFFSESYGYVTTFSPLKIIIEHTSVNPVGPIHVGTARNSFLGDSLPRLLKARGHTVATHFYVDDVGRQIAVLAYGYDVLNRPKPVGKVDLWLGLVYAITSCLIEIEELKRNLKQFEDNELLHEHANKARLDLDSWVSAAADLQERDKELFNALLEGIKRENTSPENRIAMIMRMYERNDPEVRKLVREVVEMCLDGFRETYSKVGIFWDYWDWESDLVWNGAVSDVTNRLRRSPYHTTKEGALALDVDNAAEDMSLKKRFGIQEEHEIPPLVLARSDGTTLYSTRDIAYSLLKLKQADQVINVIGVEQSLAQLQIRIALSVLTSIATAESLVHYAYELVKLPEYKMSKRRGIYVTLDEILDEATKRALREVNKRSPELPSKIKKKISEAVGRGAVKYALIDVVPSKQVVFTWDKVLNFETNSAPFIQYAYARASNILNKTDKNIGNPDYALLKEPIELELIRKIALFPDTFISAADGLAPNLLTEYAYTLASSFNSFYASLPVLKAEPQGLRDGRLDVVYSTRITLKNALKLLGIETLERM